MNVLYFSVEDTWVVLVFWGVKIGPELTCVPIFLYSVYGTPPQHGLMSGVQVYTWNANPQTLGRRGGAQKLNHYVTGPAPLLTFNDSSYIFQKSLCNLYPAVTSVPC